ncbi:MAG: MFS transporter [Candidatus Omnitrophica bacterium]|nr:MFS transporter [Candidatus Omnitrophota bacterium]
MSNYKELFKNRSFSHLWWGQFISGLGDRFTQMGLLTIAMLLSADSGEKMAWITFYSLLPFLFFGQIFGVIGDKLSRKKIMIFADILRAFLVALIPFINSHTNSLGYIYLIVFCVGTLSALFSPAKLAIIPNMIEKEKVVSANSLVASSGMFSTLVGTLIAGYLIKLFGPHPMFYINAFTFFVSAIMIGNIIIPLKEELAQEAPLSLKNIFQGMRAGLSFINRHQLILRIVQLNAVFSLFSAFFYINILNYSKVQLQVFSQGYGLLLAFLGLGLSFGAIFLGRRIGKLNYNNILFMGFGVISLANALMMFKPDFKLCIPILIFVGIGASLIMITLDSLLQRATPDSLRANVFGARGIVTNFVFLVSLVMVGKLISKFSYFYIFGFIWLAGLFVAIIIYISEGQVGYRIFRSVLRLILKLFFDLKVTGLENVPPSTKIILAGNHTSLMDGVVVAAAYPKKVYFMAAESVFKHSVWGFFARHFGFIPVKKGSSNKEAIAEAIRILEGRNTLGIFPEGHIAADGKLDEGKKGVAVIALKTGASIVPFAIEGAYYAWPLPKKCPKRHPIEIRFSKPLDIKEYEGTEDLIKEVMQDIRQTQKDMEEDGLLKVDPNVIVRHIINFE